MFKEIIKKIFTSDYDKKLIEYEKELLEEEKRKKQGLFEILYKVREYPIDNSYECSVDTEIIDTGCEMRFTVYLNKLINNKRVTLIYGNFNESVNLENVNNNVFIKSHNMEWRKHIKFNSKLNLNKIKNGYYNNGQADLSNIDWNNFSIAVLLDDKLIYKKDNNCLV